MIVFDKDLQWHKRKPCCECIDKIQPLLVCSVPNFQFFRCPGDPIRQITIQYLDDFGEVTGTEMLPTTNNVVDGIRSETMGNFEFITYMGGFDPTPCENFELVIEDGTNTYFSEVFKVPSNPCCYTRLRWKHKCDIFSENRDCMIRYKNGFYNEILLDAPLVAPFYPTVREAQELANFGTITKAKTYQKQRNFQTTPIPEFLVDTLFKMQLHSEIKITDCHLRSYKVDDLTLEDPVWQPGECLAIVNGSFTVDDKIIISCCKDLENEL